MSKYADKQFWIDTGDRALASFAQALVTTGVFESTGLIGLDWAAVLSLSGGYALASVLTSVAFRGSPEIQAQAVVVLPEPEEDIEFHNPDSPQFETETR